MLDEMATVTDHDDKYETLTLKLDSPLDKFTFEKYTGDKKRVMVTYQDSRMRTLDQIHKAWALFGDIAKFWGKDMAVEVTKEDMYEYFAFKYAEQYKTDPLHLSTASVSEAAILINMELDFCFKKGVEFSTKTWDAISDDYGFQMYCLKYRHCVICYEPADFCHVDTVGIGMNRGKVDHSKHLVMSCCRKHHIEQHTIGIKSFIDKYHIKPIKLTRSELVEMGIMTYKQAMYFREREEYLKQIGAIENDI